MSSYVFLGPTMPVVEASIYLNSTYLPPIEQGDLLRVLKAQPQAIGIIDGRFQFVPSVWHKEILAALELGVRVYGAASIGALRAAELHSFGMIGVGKIFEQYRDGELEDDDEVAVAHATAEHSYREGSDAMVNIRDCCSEAVSARVLSDSEARLLLKEAKKLYFPDRNWSAIFEAGLASGMPEASINALKRFRRTQVPLKRRDAIQLLQRMSADATTQFEPRKPKFRLERTVFFERLRDEVATPNPVPQALNVARKKVLLEILATEQADRMGIGVDETSIDETATWFRKQYGLVPEDRFIAWSQGVRLAPDEFRQVITRFSAITHVQDHYRPKIEEALKGHLAVQSVQNREPVWSQWNVALSRSNGSAQQNANRVFSLLRPILEDLKSKGNLLCFYFVRKPPDIRLRFFGQDLNLESALELSQNTGLINEFYQSFYHPETALFGGVHAMDLIHDYFDADTSVWMESPNCRHEYSLTLLQDLFEKSLSDADDVLKLWKLMSKVDDAAELPVWSLGSELGWLHIQANQRLANGLQLLIASGKLERDFLSVLAAVGMFHFNRYGVSGPYQAAFAAAMAERLSFK